MKKKNLVAKHAKSTTSGAGPHKDKKKAVKRGEIKHKKKYVESFDNGGEEYNDEAGMLKTNLHTMMRACKGLHKLVGPEENLPEWAQEKIAQAKGMIVAVWDYMESQHEEGNIYTNKIDLINKSNEQGVAEGGEDRFEFNLAHEQDRLYVTDQHGLPAGRVEFYNPDEKNPKKIDITMIIVQPKYQRQGLASAMYGYLKKQGYQILRPTELTPDGEKFYGKIKQQGVAEGAPELLKKEMLLHRHAEKLLAQNGVSKNDPDYHHHLNNTIKHLRQFGNIDLINKSNEQGVAEGNAYEDKLSESLNRALRRLK